VGKLLFIALFVWLVESAQLFSSRYKILRTHQVICSPSYPLPNYTSDLVFNQYSYIFVLMLMYLYLLFFVAIYQNVENSPVISTIIFVITKKMVWYFVIHVKLLQNKLWNWQYVYAFNTIHYDKKIMRTFLEKGRGCWGGLIV